MVKPYKAGVTPTQRARFKVTKITNKEGVSMDVTQKDKGYKVSTGDVAQNLTDKEFETLRKGKEGTTASKTILEDVAAKTAVQQDINKAKQEAAIQEEFKKQAKTGEGIKESPSIQSVQQQAQAEMPDKNYFTEVLGARDVPTEFKTIQTPYGEQVVPLPALAQVGTAIGKTATGMLDGLKAFASLGYLDTSKVKKIKEGYADFFEAVNNDIAAISLGQANPEQAINNLQMAITYNEKLTAESKRKGIDNISYWLGAGKDIETEAALNLQNLNRLKAELDDAILSGRVAKLRTQ